jgi:drug/metabolite transporter (DMT)-like permease
MTPRSSTISLSDYPDSDCNAAKCDMGPRDLIILVCLGVLWGVSFIFIRVAAPEFGAIPLMAVRVVFATIVLIPLLVTRGGVAEVVMY